MVSFLVIDVSAVVMLLLLLLFLLLLCCCSSMFAMVWLAQLLLFLQCRLTNDFLAANRLNKLCDASRIRGLVDHMGYYV